VVEDRPIMSVNHCLPVLLLAKTITHPAARSLCDSWASCFCLYSRPGTFIVSPAMRPPEFQSDLRLWL